MINWLIRQMFKIPALRINIFQEVHMYDRLDHIMADPEAMEIASSFIPDFDGWRSWSYNKDKNRFYFNDVPEEDMMGAIYKLEEMENATHIGFVLDELKDFDDGYKGRKNKGITPFLGENR